MSPYLKGTQVYLRAIEEEDANETYLSWLNNQETTKGLVTGRFPSSMQSLKSYLRSVTQGKDSVMFAICLVENDKHIGNIKLDQFDYFARTAELGVLIGEKNHRGKGIGSESCKLVLDFAFA
ncbi:MAG: GNAT family N-acetyltransferase, partial [Flavobacteriales bacterium]|nr:GNAT family N-acetyltransferase [Flavobacteriales bacterium]